MAFVAAGDGAADDGARRVYIADDARGKGRGSSPIKEKADSLDGTPVRSPAEKAGANDGGKGKSKGKGKGKRKRKRPFRPRKR